MGSYGEYGYGFEENYGYGNGGSGFSGNWQQGGGQGRKRRGNFDQMQQFEQRQGRRQRNNQGGWGNNQEGWGENQGGWGGNQGAWGDNQGGYGGNQGGWGDDGGDYYGDESYDDGYYGGSQWDDDYGQNDSYGGSRKRSRFYDDDPRGGQYMERGPHSVNFYDDYEEPYNRSGPPRQGRRRNDGGGSRKRRRENEYGWQGGKSRASRRRRRDSNNPDSGRKRGVHKKSDAEDAIYEKHKKVTVERTKREKIGNIVHAVVSAFRDVNTKLVQEQQEVEKPAEESGADQEAAQMQVEDGDQNKAEAANESAAVTDSADAATTTDAVAEADTEAKNNDENSENNKDEENSTESPKENKTTDRAATENKPKIKFEPVILGAVKCGESAMRILVGDKLQATVVVIAKKMPTRRLLVRSRDLLDEALNENNKIKDEQFNLEIDYENESLVLKQDSIADFQVLIRFTSPECSVGAAQSSEEEPSEEPADVLSPENCAIALTQLRRMRFFSKKLDSSAVSLTVIRILLFFRGSLEGWDKLPVWLALLLVSVARITLVGKKPDNEKEIKLYRADALLIRCLEIVSAGVLMPNNLGIKDPCEQDRDAGGDLSIEEADAITRAAQHVLRQIYFGQIRSVLGVEVEKTED